MQEIQTSLDLVLDPAKAVSDHNTLKRELRSFDAFGKRTVLSTTRSKATSGTPTEIETFINEFWTSKQRAANSLHEISYRACFKPQLPRFFIERLTGPDDVVYDPFMGRGTTPLEAALLGRTPVGCDINPLSTTLVAPRLEPPMIEEISARLAEVDLTNRVDSREDLLVFYHPDTLQHICALRQYLLARESGGELDHVDRWIRMVAVNRLTGHSAGFFSVYTLPPNQAVSVESQAKINDRRRQVPPYRDVPDLIIRKSRSLLSDCDETVVRRLRAARDRSLFLTGHAAETPEIPSGSVDLVATSPPFLDIVDYAQDNWLRCWFCGIEPETVNLTISRKLDEWQAAMTAVFVELARVLKPGGHVAFEVGEVRGGTLRLEETVLTCGADAGLTPVLVLINDQRFTKTSHTWGVSNESKGTNTNRVVLFRKPA